jgi:hypothetical protein
MNKGNLDRINVLLAAHKFDEAIEAINLLKVKVANNEARRAAVERSKAEKAAALKERAELKAKANAKAAANSQAANNAARAAAVARSRAEAEAERKARAAAAAAAAAAVTNMAVNNVINYNNQLNKLTKNTNLKIKNNASANNLNRILQNYMAKGTNITIEAGGSNKFNPEIYQKALDLIMYLQEASRLKRERNVASTSEAAAGITNDLKAKYNSLRSAALNSSGANTPEVLQRRLGMLLYTYYKRGYHTKRPLAQNVQNALDRKMSRWRSINWTKTSKYT